MMTVKQNQAVDEFNWLLNAFVRDAAVVSDAITVSSDGLLMAHSDSLQRDGAQQGAAIISALVSLGDSASRHLAFGEVEQVIVACGDGFLYVTAMGSAGCLGVITESISDMDNIGYQMGNFVKRASHMLTPAVVDELKASVGSA
jgi:predicted regulator of Ras-like GTPase activity (Roadblock/LC7/MglB family)